LVLLLVARPALLVQLELVQLELVQLALAQLELARRQAQQAPRLVQRLARRLAQLALAQQELALARELWAENSAELLDWRATESQRWQEKQKLKSKAQG
jgi:hypothetical protein